jgi:hypothetical protein
MQRRVLCVARQGSRLFLFNARETIIEPFTRGQGDKSITIPIDARRGMRGCEKPIASPVSG